MGVVLNKNIWGMFALWEACNLRFSHIHSSLLPLLGTLSLWNPVTCKQRQLLKFLTPFLQ